MFQVSANAPLLPHKQVLTLSEKKRQLIRIIVEILVAEAVIPGGNLADLSLLVKKLPIEIAPGGTVIKR